MAVQQSDSLVMKKSKLSFADGTKAFAALRREVEKSGLLKPTYGYYVALTTFLLIGYVASLVFLITSHFWWDTALWSISFAFFMVQFGGIMHDAGHRAIFKSPFRNDVAGQFAAIFTIFAYPQWRTTHNQHHAHTNEQGVDPDLDIIFHAFTVEQLAKLKGPVRTLTKYQHWIFYPLRALMFITTRVESLMYFIKPLTLKKVIPLGFFLIGVFGLFVAPFIFFPLWKALVFFVVANFAQGIYASNIFASNHKAMPQVPKGLKLSFFEQQVETSRNVTPGLLTDFICLGLNYQIEHHLFPSCPRPNQTKLVAFVQKACQKAGLEYTVDTVVETHRMIVDQLKHVETLVV